MYTVVVADDEEELRKAIIRRVDWESIGFTVVGEAENGIEALELVEKTEPDLLLTDIRMPFVSGIELARQVREIRPATQIAFLSGFDDFTYAQQAIQYNIISYMLKPISAADLSKELEVIKGKIDHIFEDFAYREQARIDVTQFLMGLLLDGTQWELPGGREKELISQAIECGMIKEKNNSLQYMVMTTGFFDNAGNNATKPEYVHSIDMILKKYVKYSSFYLDRRIVSLLIATSASYEKYLHILTGEIIQSAERIMHLKSVIGVSRIASELSSCHEAYRESINAVSYSDKLESGVFYIGDLEHLDTLDTEGMINAVAEIETLFRGGIYEDLETYITELFKQLQLNGVPRVTINFLLIQMLSSISRIIHAVTEGEEMQDVGLLKRITLQEGSLQETQEQFLIHCSKALDLISSQRKKNSQLLSEKTQQIIDSRYSDPDISLCSISNEINVSPNYLSALIKKNTGQTFIDLLTTKRMEIAKELLLCTSMKIREITEKCGYNDQHYFSYCFKKHHGISPNTLRQQNLCEE